MHFWYHFLIQAGLTAIPIYWLTWTIYCRFFHPLRSIPGPLLASYSRAWIVFNTARGDVEHTQRALHKKYGNKYKCINVLRQRLTYKATLFASPPTRFPALTLKLST